MGSGQDRLEAQPPRVCCIVVNWNGWQDTSACLAALSRQTYSSLEIILVDNGSSDDSVANARTLHPSVHVIEAGANLGFARACNLGARQALSAGADFLWFLNNDTVAPPATLSTLVAKALEVPQAGIIGSVLHFLHDPEKVQAWGGGLINLWTGYSRHFTSAEPMTGRTYLTFASVLVRRDTFRQLNGLSEEAFLYFEDADFSLRARAAGWQLAVAENTCILHKEGGSSVRRSALLDRMVTSAGLVFLTRHAPVPAVARLLYLGSRIARRLLRSDWAAARAVMRGAADWREGRAATLPPT